MKRRQLLYVIALASGLAGCAGMRGVDLGPGNAQTFAVEVTNNRASTITVSYSAGGSENTLGTVASNRTERFVIPLDAAGNVTLRATTSSGAAVGTRTVMLQSGTTARVTFQ
jgi:hypothetical protein